jgi:hypothetical protein
METVARNESYRFLNGDNGMEKPTQARVHSCVNTSDPTGYLNGYIHCR